MAAGLLAVLMGLLAVRAQVTVIMACILVIAIMLLPRRAVLGVMILLVCVLGLIRRLISPGRIDYDPLVLVPILLLVLVLITSDKDDEPAPLSTTLNLAFSVLVALPVLSVVVVARPSLAGVYAAGIQSAAFLAMWSAARGRLPNLWPSVFRSAPIVGGLLALYGLYQFFFLPGWDRLWMIRSGLNSVGSPEPLLVRVFGASESPGLFAMVLGACLVTSVYGVVGSHSVAMRMFNVGLASLMVGTLFFTGVRTALIAALVALIYMAYQYRNVAVLLWTAVLGASFVVGVRALLTRFTTSDSTVFDADRYSIANSGSDRSLNARLGLLSDVGDGLARPLGTGLQVSGARVRSLDNSWIDLLVSFGPLMALAFTVVFIAIVRSVLSSPPRTDRASVAKMGLSGVTVYLLVFLMAANIFATTSGLVASVVLGWALGAVVPRPRRAATDGAVDLGVPTQPR
ncbi:hypothetical protein [Nocardioides plantarum]